MLRKLVVQIDKKALRAFKRRAIYSAKKNREHIEAITVDRLAPGEYKVIAFNKLKILSQSRSSVEYSLEDKAALDKINDSKGYITSTIHTHLEVDECPSLTDHVSGAETGEPIFGICNVSKSKSGRYKTKLAFWTPQPESEIIVKKRS